MANLVRWEPLSLRRAMDRLFEESFVRPWGALPTVASGALTVDMYETPEEVVITTAVPGIDPEDVEVSVTGDTLTISGECKAEEDVKGANYLCRERRHGYFSRSLALPANVVSGEATADYANGVLTLRLPKAEEVRPRRIKIEVK